MESTSAGTGRDIVILVLLPTAKMLPTEMKGMPPACVALIRISIVLPLATFPVQVVPLPVMVAELPVSVTVPVE